MEEHQEKWMELCTRTAKEQDPERLMELVSHINQLLDAKARRLNGGPPAAGATS